MQILYKKQTIFRAPMSAGGYWLSRFVAMTRSQWFELGNIESCFLSRKLLKIPVRSPIYITGLARSGTTILLEIITSHRSVASHRYHDFPFTMIPYTWRKFLKLFSRSAYIPQERSHFDGLQVTPNSPEAFEEPLWLHFFPERLAERSLQGIDGQTKNDAFERFYQAHIRKLILSEGADRYAAKGNSNLARLAYLRRLYPDAKFVVMIRHPLAHIASLMKQHQMFCEMEKNDPRLLDYMRQTGHFEFGLDRRVLAVSDETLIFEAIHAAWGRGDEASGWAMYWDMVYGGLARIMRASPELASQMLIIKYESLCSEPQRVLTEIERHCDLSFDVSTKEHWLNTLHAPGYYEAKYTMEEQQGITAITSKTAEFFGYNDH